MRRFLFILLLAACSLAPSAAAAINSLVVESRAFPTSATACTLGVWLTNDIGLTSITVPLELRSTSGGAYLTNNFTTTVPFNSQSGGRLINSPLGNADPSGSWPGASITRSAFDVTAINTCSGSLSHTWSSAANNFAPSSPDAVFFASVSQGDPSFELITLEPGSDGIARSQASFRFLFTTNANVGCFIIDTCCRTPANHLGGVDIDVNEVSMNFTQGVISVGGANCGGPPNQRPNAICRNVTDTANISGQAFVAPSEVNNGSSDPEGGTLVFSLFPAGPFLPGANNVKLIVSDPLGAADTCDAVVTVVSLPGIIRVPADYPTIQAGINAAVDGNTVLVASGSYSGSFQFGVKSVILQSESGPSSTELLLGSIGINAGAQPGPTIEGFTLRNSAASVTINVPSDAGFVIRRCWVRNNPVDQLVIHCSGGILLATENVFVGNGGNSCIGVSGGTATIIDNTFDANGRGFYCVGGTCVAKNNIVSHSMQYGVYGSLLQSSYNDVWANGTNYAGGASPGSGDISADPKFENAPAFVYALQSNSPCINAGDPNSIYNDLDGSRSDIGALPPTCDPNLASSDCDLDGISKSSDNCPTDFNPGQEDSDADGVGNACDNCLSVANSSQADSDGDGRGDACDNCPALANSTQTNADGDGIGDVCDACPNDPLNDVDGDGLCGNLDNCPTVSNSQQPDMDQDGVGDACDPCTDTDGDGFASPGFQASTCGADNCPSVSNPSQDDTDGDGIGDACDNCVFIANESQTDTDLDNRGDACDNCPAVANFDQADPDLDGLGSGCDPCPLDSLNDADGDGRCANVDNCPNISNPTQSDADGDGVGDACDVCTDIDGDGFGNPEYAANTCLTDNCPSMANPSQIDADNDGIGDACDNCTTTPNSNQLDADVDGRGDVCDNCPAIANANQQDSDGDGHGNVCDNCATDFNPTQTDTDHDVIGDVCDACILDSLNDQDGDGICANVDNCRTIANASQSDTDGDGVGDVCDNCPAKQNPLQEETDGDGIADSCDNCPSIFNASQQDADHDGVGNACDPCILDPLNDPDVDGVCNSTDNCPAVFNPDQADTNGNNVGDVCDCSCQCHGDPACDSVIANIVDVVSTVNVAFRGAATITDPSPTCPWQSSDTNCSGTTDVIDVVKVVNVAFRGANVAAEYCESCP